MIFVTIGHGLSAGAFKNESFPLKQFSDLGLAKPISRALQTEGLTHPTPIQEKVIPAMMAGNDILGTAQTGTGKTAAFLLPILHMLAESSMRLKPRTCRVLVLVPTRELAGQIMANLRTLGRHVRPSSVLIVGGARSGPQIKAFTAGVDIAIATPGRLEDLMRSGAIKLNGTEMVILDEADQMLDMGFIPAIRRVMAEIPREQRQTVMLSATMSKPIRSLTREFLTSPVEVSVDPVCTPVERIEQMVQFVSGSEKRSALVKLVSDDAVGRAIVFTRTKRGADKLHKHLSQAGLSSDAIHGDKNQRQRERALKAFRGGRVKILVATDVAARGIHIDAVSHVINFELPFVPEAYVHRIGRTARAGESGVAVSFCDPSERSLLRDIERTIGYRLKTEGEPGPEQEQVRPGGRKPARNRRGERAFGKPQRPHGHRRKTANTAGFKRKNKGKSPAALAVR